MKKHLKHLLAVLLAVFIIGIGSASAQLADTPWPMYHYDTKHTSQTPYDTTNVKPDLKWKFNVGNGIESTPVIDADGTIYVGTFKDKFYAVNPDGTEKWVIEKPGEEFRSTAAIAKDGTIYVGATSDHVSLENIMHDEKSEYGTPKLYAINPDGTIKWEFIAGGLYSGTYAAPLIGPDGTIYIGSGETLMQEGTKGGGKYYAVNPDGTEKWGFDTGTAFYTTAAIADDGTIYATCADNNLYAINPEDGSEKWRFTAKGYFDGSPAIGADGTIYAGSVDKNLYAITPEGKEKWHFTAKDIVEATPSIAKDGTIYMGVIDISERDKNLYALNPDGSLKWKFETGGGVYATPAIAAEGTLYFGSYDNNLYAVTPDGEEKWRFAAEGGIVAPPALSDDGTIYFGSWDNHLYAIGGQSQVSEATSQVQNFPWLYIIIAIIGLVLILGTVVLIVKTRRQN